MLITKKAVCIIIVIVSILAILAMATGSVLTYSAQNSKGTVVIDAGHGGVDGGVFYGEIKESNINLEIANMLKKSLEEQNFKVVMTRTTDQALDTTKRGDMQKRKEIIENAQPIMAISIHVNKWTTAIRRGVQVFYDDTNRNKIFAEYMQSVLNTHINSKYAKRTDLLALSGDYFITKCTKYPTVIVETGFISNSQDREFLVSKSYRADLVGVITKAILAIAMD